MMPILLVAVFGKAADIFVCVAHLMGHCTNHCLVRSIDRRIQQYCLGIQFNSALSQLARLGPLRSNCSFVSFRKPTEAVFIDSRIMSFSSVPRCSIVFQNFDEGARIEGMSTSVKGGKVEAVLVLVTLASNTDLDILASWRRDGRFSDRIDRRGKRRERGVG